MTETSPPARRPRALRVVAWSVRLLWTVSPRLATAQLCLIVLDGLVPSLQVRLVGTLTRDLASGATAHSPRVALLLGLTAAAVGLSARCGTSP
ncbi:hypothetical protein [Arsenicicoccus dermatophilus]|uniref:hypothetical protein n=1 Tax=Arsenicicoccus dermatophilus TaxID=1076331 RepID=UPI00391715A7